MVLNFKAARTWGNADWELSLLHMVDQYRTWGYNGGQGE